MKLSERAFSETCSELADDMASVGAESPSAFELSRCAADAVAWGTIDVTASGQNLGWWLCWLDTNNTVVARASITLFQSK